MKRRVVGLLALLLVLSAAPLSAYASPEGFDEAFAAARTLALNGQREAALVAYSNLLATHPGNADVLLGRGRLYAWMKNWAAAEADLNAATAADPGYADAWAGLGDMFVWSDRPQQAVTAYGHWCLLAPNDPAPLLARGRAYRLSNNKPAAQADFEAAAKRGADPTLVKAALNSLVTPPIAFAITPPDAVADARYLWSASVGLDLTDFSGGGLLWLDNVATLRRQFDGGSVGIESLASHRFGIWDRAWALDAYTGLWNRAYANLRFQNGTDAVLFPRTRWRAELFQGVGKGWELSASYDRLNYASEVTIWGLGAARYMGNWYVRWNHLYVPSTAVSPSWSNSDRVTVRNYFKGDADNYVEIAAGLGNVVEATGFVTTGAQASHSWSTSASLVRFVSPQVGFKIGVDTGYGVELEPRHSAGMFATLYYRW